MGRYRGVDHYLFAGGFRTYAGCRHFWVIGFIGYIIWVYGVLRVSEWEGSDGTGVLRGKNDGWETLQ